MSGRANAVVSGRSGATTGSGPSNSWDDTAFRTNSIPKDTSTQDNGQTLTQCYSTQYSNKQKPDSMRAPHSDAPPLTTVR